MSVVYGRPKCPNQHRSKRIRVRVWSEKKQRTVKKKVWGCNVCGTTSADPALVVPLGEEGRLTGLVGQHQLVPESLTTQDIGQIDPPDFHLGIGANRFHLDPTDGGFGRGADNQARLFGTREDGDQYLVPLGL